MHTAQHIVSKCLSGRLAADRTVILATHHLSLCLPIASYFVELNDGKILRQGPAQEFVIQNSVTTNKNTEKGDTTAEFVENEADSLLDSSRRVGKTGNGKLVEKEALPEGRISWRAYYTYIRAVGTIAWVLTVILLFVRQALDIANQVTIYFIKHWLFYLTIK